MASRAYVIPDLDDEDDQKQSINLFSKRLKTDNSTIPIETVQEPEPSTSSTTSIPSSSSSSLLVHSRQRGNPLLKHFRQVKWEYSDTILGGADYSMSRSSCALFLSLRYHTLNPNYIYDRLKSTKIPYQLKILLVQCDVTEPSQSLKELARLCILYEFTLLVSWTDEESARYLETYKIMEGKSAENLLDTQQHQSNDYLTKYTEMITQVKSVNKSDAQTLLHAFGSLESILNATNEQLTVCPGLGALKAQRLFQSFNQPFKRIKQKQMQKTNTQQLDLSNFDEEF